MAIVIYLIVGAILGAIGKMLIGESMGWVGTIICGILGALLGGVLGGWIGKAGNIANDINIWSIILSIVGTVIVFFIYNMITRGSARNTTR